MENNYKIFNVNIRYDQSSEEESDDTEEDSDPAGDWETDFDWMAGKHLEDVEKDIYTGYGFDTDTVEEGEEELRMVLNNINQIKMKVKRSKRKSKSNKATQPMLEDDEDDGWGEDMTTIPNIRRSRWREEAKQRRALMGEGSDKRETEGLVDEEVRVLQVEGDMGGGETGDDETDEESVDLVDNLTYSEDSLSVLRGRITTPLGKDLECWIVSDTGAMTQLMHRDYARKMKLPVTQMPESQQFTISGPGGGSDRVTSRVVMDVTFDAGELEGKEEEYVHENGILPGQITIPMSFGLVEELPVPILWGGNQMRKYHAHDLHERKIMTFKKNEKTYVVETKSWLASCVQMRESEDKRVVKAVKSFLPSKERLVNMITGGRSTSNVSTPLYPGKGNIVRLARQNARVDEGLNLVDLINEEDIRKEYGDMITVTSCVNTGEAYIVVHNNTSRALSLPGGKLEISVKPIMSLPICKSSSTEFQELKDLHQGVAMEGPYAEDADNEEGSSQEEGRTSKPLPRTSVVWSCDGLTDRIKNGDMTKLRSYLKEFNPDMMGLLDVRWTREGNDHTQVKKLSEGEEYYQLLKKAVGKEYFILLNLGEKERG